MENRNDSSGISLVVCCYNSAARIEETLRHLAFQKIDSFSCEVVVVDNGSTDDTASLARRYWDSFGPQNIPLTVVNEPTSGLSHARDRGVNAARYSIVIFCDDDNWLPPEYTGNVKRLMTRYTSAGAIGGWCDGAFAIPLQDKFIPMTGSLAVGKHGRVTGPAETVNGAGMAVRRADYIYIADQHPSLLSDRKGNVLTSGGDAELSWRMKFAGKEVIFDEVLYFRHFIPAGRLRSGYFFRLCLLAVSPVLVLNQYKYCFDRPGSSFGRFMVSTLTKQFEKFRLLLPRMFLGKYKFHSLIYFLQSWKIIGLAVVRAGKFRRSFDEIVRLRKELAIRL